MEIVAQVHPNDLDVQVGNLPEKPGDFYEGFCLPGHDFRKPLQELYPETVQKNMKFMADEHLYVVDHGNGKKIPTALSVTGVAHKFEGDPFDADRIIPMMMNSSNWPRVHLCHGAEQVSAPSKFRSDKWCLLVRRDVDEWKTMGCLRANTTVGKTGDEIYTIIRECMENPDREDGYFMCDGPMTHVEVKEFWSRNGTYARNRGTYVHNMAELALEGLPFNADEPEMQVFFWFLKTYMIPAQAKIYSTEQEILYLDADVAGSVDAVFQLPDGSFVVVDWKVSEKLKRQMITGKKDGYKKMTGVFKHLDRSKGAGYGLQLSLYQRVFETQYNMRVSERILVSLHAGNPFVTSVPYLEKEATYLLDEQVAMKTARDQVSGFKCELSGQTLINPVRLPDGRLASHKVALMTHADGDLTPDAAVAEKVEGEVMHYFVPPVFDTDTCKKWKDYFPKSGQAMIVPFAAQ
jgi:hypothetical protein